MKTILSFENLVKLTKTVKLMNTFLFEEYQQNIFKFCPVPKGKKKNVSNLNLFLNQINSNNPTDMKILNFIESEKERFDWDELEKNI